MKMRNFLFIVFLTFLGSHQVIKGESVSPYPGYEYGKSAGAQIFEKFLQDLRDWGLIPVAIALGALYSLSVVQKDNPQFFASVVRGLEWPFFLTQRKLQKFFCNGQSLTWNEVASWHNRITQLLTPLTKTTSVIDLSKDRRLRSMDQEDDVLGAPDAQWAQTVAHIEKEFLFMKKVLAYRLRYYKDLPKKTNKSKNNQKNAVDSFKEVGKGLVRTSLNRNEEIAFGLEEAEVYLTEIITYCKSVPQFSALDKEHLKRLMNAICSTCKHLGVLVDEVTAADRTRNKLPMSTDGELTRGYAGGSAYSGGYSSYGVGGSNVE